MPVPTYDQFIEPILRYLATKPDGAPTRDVYDAAAVALGLTDADRAELLPSGVQAVYKNRAGWAHDRLKRSGLSSSLRRGFWKLTDAGRKFAAENPAPLPERVVERLAADKTDVRLRREINVSQSLASFLEQYPRTRPDRGRDCLEREAAVTEPQAC